MITFNINPKILLMPDRKCGQIDPLVRRLTLKTFPLKH